jgi:predicted AlkP superfamily pyrophosphatase or phosphodiesterase
MQRWLYQIRFLAIAILSLLLSLALFLIFAQGSSSQSPPRPRPVPKVILISLDGATPRLLDQYFASGVLKSSGGLGQLKQQGITARQNVTITPSLTAPSHVAIATGSSAARNNINANVFHLLASPFNRVMSGFAAPIGAYSLRDGVAAQATTPTAEPLWIKLRAAGKRVVAATFPGADGVDVVEPESGRVLQSRNWRTVDYTVPYGTSAGVNARGIRLTASDFQPASEAVKGQLAIAQKTSYSPVLQTREPIDRFVVDNVPYSLIAAALDSTNDGTTNYDTLIVFDSRVGISPGPFRLPAAGPAVLKPGQPSQPFYLERSRSRAGTSFFLTALTPDLATVKLARYAVNYIPRSEVTARSVDDIHGNVGFWRAQPDFRIPQRLAQGFDDFSDAELESIYEDQSHTFVDYQTRLATWAIRRNPNADLVMLYSMQPDGSGHQFLLTDPRQASDPRNPDSIGTRQDAAKIARYAQHLQEAYQSADGLVQKVIETVGTNANGVPNSNIFVVSDHGFLPFHTAVSINNLLENTGFERERVRAISSGPAVNIYFNLEGRGPQGTVSRAEYVALQQKVMETLRGAIDSNPNYTDGTPLSIFDKIFARPVPLTLTDANFGLSTSEMVGQDAGDVFAILKPGYNFDGTQNPVVQRSGDAPSGKPIFSIPSFYGAHGYDPTLPSMSAIFYAAGPQIQPGTLEQVRNIDIAPTILQLLGVRPAPTVQGRVIPLRR